jgi:hypothetical protein
MPTSTPLVRVYALVFRHKVTEPFQGQFLFVVNGHAADATDARQH